MKHFKLINIYPGMPSWVYKGVVVISQTELEYVPIVLNPKLMHNNISHKHVHDYPGIWEPIEDVAHYNILEFRRANNEVTKFYNGYYKVGNETLSLCDSLRNHHINKVQRLSDNAIFTTGERISLGGKAAVITGYTISPQDGGLNIMAEYINSPGRTITSLDKIAHFHTVTRLPTADNELLAIGDKVTIVSVELKALRDEVVTEEMIDIVNTDNTLFAFKSKDSAVQFLKENTPLLTYTEVVEVISRCHLAPAQEAKLHTLIREKLRD